MPYHANSACCGARRLADASMVGTLDGVLGLLCFGQCCSGNVVRGRRGQTFRLLVLVD